MNDRDSTYADKILGDAMRLVTAGVDPELGSETVADALAALAKQAKALRDSTYETVRTKRVKYQCSSCNEDGYTEVEVSNHAELAKTMAQTAKMIDETARLVQFCSGKADSRPDVAGLPVDILRALTNDQLQQVMTWVETSSRANSEA